MFSCVLITPICLTTNIDDVCPETRFDSESTFLSTERSATHFLHTAIHLPNAGEQQSITLPFIVYIYYIHVSVS